MTDKTIFKEGVSGQSRISTNGDFSISSKEILEALMISKEHGTSIGIKASAFGPDYFITAVENIILEEGQTLVQLKHYDSTGYILPSYKINLLEIQSTLSFRTPFRNPYLKSLSQYVAESPETDMDNGR